MTIPIVSTKLYVPPPRPGMVPRPRLTDRLTEGLSGKLSLVSASAGFGKTTLASDWVAGLGMPAAWLSLEEADNDPARFMAYFIAALQQIGAPIGEGAAGILQAPQPPSIESIMTAIINEIAVIPHRFVLVLDDYHVIRAAAIHDAVSLLLEHLPASMHLVIAAREDPPFPLARLRVRNQLSELRAPDLRFDSAEAAEFLNRTIGLNLAPEHIAALEARTEGWIAGLQLAALSMKRGEDASSFVRSFSGSHRHVLDYLVEEVFRKLPERTQSFLLHTSVLDRMCGPLCDAIISENGGNSNGPSPSGQQMLSELERDNLFIVPLDGQRRWYRYHHLFAESLRQRLRQHSSANAADRIAELHMRASDWYAASGLELEALHHAAEAKDVERAARLIEGDGMPLHFRGAAEPVLRWLNAQPIAAMSARPALLVIHASALLLAGQFIGAEQKALAAEVALAGCEQDERVRDLIGHIASIRASLAVSQHQADAILSHSQRALSYLSPGNLPVRTATIWTLGYAYHLQGDRSAAIQAYAEAIAISESIGHLIINVMARLGLGDLQIRNNLLPAAADTYRHIQQLAGNPPMPAACEAHLGLARVSYEWNDIAAARHHAEQSVLLAKQIEYTDRLVECELFLVRLQLAEGDGAAAAGILARAEQRIRQHRFVRQQPNAAAARIQLLLRDGKLDEAAQLVVEHDLPQCQARIDIAKGKLSEALATLSSLRRQAEEKGWEDERIKAMALQALALRASGNKDKAIRAISDVLALAEPSGFIRLFIDEGMPMARLLSEAAGQDVMPAYIGRLLSSFEPVAPAGERLSEPHRSLPVQPLIEPLSERELTILQLIAEGLSNNEISKRLFLALSTVKGHNQQIFGKLQVARRTEAVARARELGLLKR